MITIDLSWKNYFVNLNKVTSYLKENCSSNFDGLFCSPELLQVVFKNQISQEDLDIVNNYWDNATPQTFAQTTEEIIALKINDAIIFGNRLIFEATVGNVALGITQANKTQLVSDYFGVLQRYLKEGSLYAAMSELDTLIAAGVPENLAPFVTTERMQTFKSKIYTYLTTP